MTRRLARFAAATGLGLLAAIAIAPVTANPMADLSGRWSGNGSIASAGGSVEQMRCVATYFHKRVDTLQQNLRCASPSYKIETTADLLVRGAFVVGQWQEKIHGRTGQVSGRLTEKGFSLAIMGDSFSAALDLTTSACKQSIDIKPRGLEISRISIGLGKC